MFRSEVSVDELRDRICSIVRIDRRELIRRKKEWKLLTALPLVLDGRNSPLLPPVDALRQLLGAVMTVHLPHGVSTPGGGDPGAEVGGAELVVGEIRELVHPEAESVLPGALVMGVDEAEVVPEHAEAAVVLAEYVGDAAAVLNEPELVHRPDLRLRPLQPPRAVLLVVRDDGHAAGRRGGGTGDGQEEDAEEEEADAPAQSSHGGGGGGGRDETSVPFYRLCLYAFSFPVAIFWILVFWLWVLRGSARRQIYRHGTESFGSVWSMGTSKL